MTALIKWMTNSAHRKLYNASSCILYTGCCILIFPYIFQIQSCILHSRKTMKKLSNNCWRTWVHTLTVPFIRHLQIHVAAAKYLQTCRYRWRSSVKVYNKHQNDGKTLLCDVICDIVVGTRWLLLSISLLSSWDFYTCL